MLEVLIDNRDGQLWDVSELTAELSWKTSRIAKPSSVELTLIRGALYQSAAFKLEPGAIVRVRQGETPVFFGYIFTVEQSSSEQVKLTAYDQLRYWLASDTYVFANQTAAEIIRRIAGDLGAKIGELPDTKYVIPSMVEDGQKLLDIALKALDLTLIAGQGNYMLFDHFGALTVRDINVLELFFSIGDDSLLYDYSFKRSIDEETYTRVKLVRDNKETKARDVYVAQDSANIAKWGRLQLYHKANDSMNEAQLKELLNNLMSRHNREQRTLSLQALGDIRVRAGHYVFIFMKELGLEKPFLVEECSHSFTGGEHTMNLELKVIA
ncbi:hypothetical protein SAMN02799630_03944 [Paenibacillus sp. UNCCL117]|uniref:XkdQ/YqbQ family protein n=1 Tax=unclassified Paenibacillus TaxID=185978 RepID=UPI00088B17A1|nr:MULTISPECIES: hypothetical protein [unclassified Paenibacillus]SDD75552.1 hypothetical protein SAMN04488602_11310 [Paenibacillus sp. cl123]SFW52202.1 hypothetical protein SAMN02799630_03944 [Paenibacillus sp. UNCCL117]